jgi:flagellar hook-associated protein 2
MAGVSLGGMASGLDTQTIISQLMAVDRAPEARLKLQTSAAQARQSTLTDIATRVRSLANTVKDLGSVTTWIETQSLDISDSSKLNATRLSGAAPGGHDITVSTLARSEQRSYAFTKGAGTLNLGDSTHVAIGDNDDGQAVADKVNAAPSSPFYAVFVKDPLNDTTKDRLVLTRKDTGYYDPAAADALKVTGTGFTGTDWTTGEELKEGVNASFTVDGGPAQASRSNVVNSAIPGLQLTLKATGTTSVTVSPPGPDNNAVKTKLQAFVDQYNSTVDFIRTELAEKRVPNATTDSDARKGPLFADTQLTGMLAQLRGIISGKAGPGGAIKSLADLGVSTGAATGGTASADAVAGKLTLDATKLTDALANNRLDVKSFMTDSVNGISAKLTKLLDPVGKVTTGLLDLRAKQAGDEQKSYADQIATIESRLTDKAARLQAQFTAMEQALAQSQSQQSWLTAQLR